MSATDPAVNAAVGRAKREWVEPKLDVMTLKEALSGHSGSYDGHSGYS